MAMPDREDEWAMLLHAADRGDSAAYRRFWDQVSPVMRGIVRARAGGLGDDACEDIVQEVLLAIHLKRHTWQADKPLRPWLYAIARHKVVDAFRKRGRRVQLPIEDFAGVLPAVSGPDPFERHDAERLIERLDERSAEVLKGMALAGEDSAAVGLRLNMSDGAVRVALHRALKRLAVLRESEEG